MFKHAAPKAAATVMASAGSSAPSDSRKRKRESALPSAEQVLEPSIVVKPHPSSISIKPRILHPLMLISREHLPLSALDLTLSSGDFTPSRFYESHIRILELEGRLGSNVLLAQSETRRSVYAIEPQGNGLYVLCKLGGWVDVGRLAQLATVVCLQRVKLYKPVATERFDFKIQPDTTPNLHYENRKKRLAIEEMHMKNLARLRVRSQSVAQDSPSPALSASAPTSKCGNQGSSDTTSLTDSPDNTYSSPQKLPEMVQTQADSIIESEATAVKETKTIQTPEEIFQNVRTQYLEALYHSMGSLAYFAKGPLSRARAAFQLDSDFNMETCQLIDFLNTLVMDTVLIDKKYRDAIPGILSTLKVRVDDSEKQVSKSKKRKTKKLKLGKDGMYPCEDDHVHRWWNSLKLAVSDSDENEDKDKETKYHIFSLRRRETQLQMILIMEILALERVARPVESEDSQLPGTSDHQGNTSKEETAKVVPKKRNRRDLLVLLELHADRHCIWQSTMLDEVKALAESRCDDAALAANKSERANLDPLKDFSVDIILPFFSARLPELCDSINRKMGGPVLTQKTPSSTKKLAYQKTKPVAPTRQTAPSVKDRKMTLEKALYNERRANEQMRRSASRGSDAIALMRAQTTMMIPGLKRESSEPLPSANARMDVASSLLRERSMNTPSRRTSSSSGNHRKAEKKAQADAQLQDAISALKKPNRVVAGKAISEEAEKRVAFSPLQAKRPKKLSSTSSASNVLVKATPASNRFKDVFASGVQTQSKLSVVTSASPDYVPSSASVISASSALRLNAGFRRPNLLNVTPMAEKVRATPQKGNFAMTIPELSFFANESAIPPSPPLAGQAEHDLTIDGDTLSSFELPSSPGLPLLSETPSKTQSAVCGSFSVMYDTPIKSKLAISRVERQNKVMIVEQDITEATAVSKVAGYGEEGNEAQDDLTIYQRLGWDIELDELAS